MSKSAPVVIEDDCWIVGSYNVVAPGLHLGKRSIVLTGSMVSRSVLEEQVVAGAPARPLSRNQPVYVQRTLEEKLAMMADFLDEFAAAQGLVLKRTDGVWHFPRQEAVFWVGRRPEQCAGGLVLGIVCQASEPPRSGEGLIDLSRRCYHPTRHPLEIRLMRFLKSYRARFVPADQPVVGAELKPGEL